MNDGRPQAKWEPGTLDNTRRNIGSISTEEAARMAKVLGGEVFTEKSTPINYDAFPKKAPTYAHRATGKSAASISGAPSARPPATETQKKAVSVGGLPEIPAKEAAKMDKLMMNDDYKIKQNYGIFNFVRKFKKNGTELVSKSFVEFSLKADVDHIQALAASVKTLVQLAPDSYKAKIMNEEHDKFRLLRAIGNWTLSTYRTLLVDLQTHADTVTVGMMSPFIKAVYRDMLKIYYLGETNIPNLIKDVYADLIKYPKAEQPRLLKLSKEALTEWLHVYTQVIKGLYPLLMRMCSQKYEAFPYFFMNQTSAIFSFLGINKFDLLLPQKKGEQTAQADDGQAEDAEKTEENEEKQEAQKPGPTDDMVRAGLNLLNTLFPQAGFNQLETMPDMFPYFEPMYDFDDGYNVIAPENPLMITMVLLHISEDIFQGCRNIQFSKEPEDDNSDKDTLAVALNEWSAYREIIFEKNYLDELLELVNKQYTKNEFKSSTPGKKLIMSLLWQTKYNFLPHFEFEQLLLEKPNNDSKQRPLCLRVKFLKNAFLAMSQGADNAAKDKGTVVGVANPWDRYEFDIPNIVSKRMDVLLGAKRGDKETAATNANLIKYAACVLSVLDWWINSKDSPAYSTDSSKIYRINEKDGGPAFSVPLRSDQNKLFADAVKAAVQKQKEASAKTEGADAAAKATPQETAP
ncbi:MAG: hypothetical protein K2N31_10060 [Treponemataceae bacterium]|nr:hypothetical protein [Treponemataceae bacterium]